MRAKTRMHAPLGSTARVLLLALAAAAPHPSRYCMSLSCLLTLSFCLAEQSEQKATEFAEAAGTRLEAFAGMLRGAADVAFCGNDASARRLRHHLFR